MTDVRGSRPVAQTPGEIYVARHEAKERDNFLRAVTINEGIALCENGVSGTVLRLAAVRITGRRTMHQMPCAQLLRLERGDNTLNLPIPHGASSILGFFIGHNSDDRTIGTAFRQGPYPGTPLIGTARMLARPDEILVSLNGIKQRETEEQVWANQISLFSRLGFDPAKTRGLFWKVLQTASNSGRTRNLIKVTPPHPDYPQGETDIHLHRPDIFQFLGYEVEHVQQPLQAANPTENPRHHSNGTSHKYQTPATVGRLIVHNLQGAFEARVVPTRA